jgi:hypothetical protein
MENEKHQIYELSLQIDSITKNLLKKLCKLTKVNNNLA